VARKMMMSAGGIVSGIVLEGFCGRGPPPGKGAVVREDFRCEILGSVDRDESLDF